MRDSEREYVRIAPESLLRFCADVFRRLGLTPGDAQAASDVLVAADMRGIESHGVGRLWRYHNGLKTGLMLPAAESEVVRDSPSSARVSHFFGAIKIDRFREPAAFRRDMDRMLARLRACPPAEGCERVYFAGQKEREAEAECRRDGISVLQATYEDLCRVGEEEGVAAPPTKEQTGGEEGL